jgi:hypothetical protein
MVLYWHLDLRSIRGHDDFSTTTLGSHGAMEDASHAGGAGQSATSLPPSSVQSWTDNSQTFTALRHLSFRNPAASRARAIAQPTNYGTLAQDRDHPFYTFRRLIYDI